jgi:hypothetical protein
MSSTSTFTPPAASQPAPQQRLLCLEPWAQPHFDRWGSEPRSTYVERFWLPVIGPSSLVLARSITTGFESNNGSYRVDASHQATAIGVSPSQLRRVLDRLVVFGVAKTLGPDMFCIRTMWPVIGSGAIRQLTASLHQQHSDWLLLTDTLDADNAPNRVLWRLTIAAHAKGVSAVDLDAQLRRLRCDQQFRIELAQHHSPIRSPVQAIAAMFFVRTAAAGKSTHRDLGPAVAVARNTALRGNTVAISRDESQWWSLTYDTNTHQWSFEHLYTIASLFDPPLSAQTNWQQRALDLLARLDPESASTTPATTNSPTTMEVNAS